MKLAPPNQTLPITESNEFLQAALQDADIHALVMAMVHITGDDSMLDYSLRPMIMPSLQGESDGLDETQRQAIRARALTILKNYRDSGSPAPEPLSRDHLHRMLKFIGGDTIPESRYDMFLETAGLSVGAGTVHSGNSELRKLREGFQVLIIGGGMSGILAGIRLDQLGIPYTIIEKNADLGGTWYSNAYPGCRVDIPSHFYSYSFAPSANWPGHYSQRDDLLAYFNAVAAAYDIRRNIQFDSEVVDCTWGTSDNCWTVRVRRSDGQTDAIRVNAVISAVGTLSRPNLPDITGQGSFKGKSCHTGHYDRSIETTGKRVAVVGTAASAVQAVGELAKTASKLTVFQRSAHWVFPNPTYQQPIGKSTEWLLTHVPGFRNWYRLVIFAKVADGVLIVGRIDPEWPHQERSCSEINDQIRIGLTQAMTDLVADKPDLVDKIIPSYPPFADRIIPNDGSYLRALTRDNVELVTAGISQIDETGIVDQDGRHHDLDVIIYATGFHATDYLGPMELYGVGGRSLKEFWNGEPRGHLGITVPDFPNFFMMWGPGTSSGNMIFSSECQLRFITSAIEKLAIGEVGSIDCRRESYDEYVARYRKDISKLACSGSSVRSWWKGASGDVLTYLPFEVADYWKWTRQIDASDYIMHPAETEPA